MTNPLQLPWGFRSEFFLSDQGPNPVNTISLSGNFLAFDHLSPSSFVDPIKISIDLDIKSLEPKIKNPKKKCWKKEWKLNHVFQELWVEKFPWAKVMLGCDWKLIMVCYKVCSEIKGRGKIWCLNLIVCKNT
jgi:hypothetical protein